MCYDIRCISKQVLKVKIQVGLHDIILQLYYISRCLDVDFVSNIFDVIVCHLNTEVSTIYVVFRSAPMRNFAT